jgi:hypothetical protein
MPYFWLDSRELPQGVGSMIAAQGATNACCISGTSMPNTARDFAARLPYS